LLSVKFDFYSFLRKSSVAGLGYDVDVNNQNNINVSYNFQGEGSKYTNHGLALNYRYKF